jgi:TM2 domain-containing membrane protein YozV
MTEAAQKAVDEKYCSECGEIIKAKAEICPNCGVRQSSPPLVSSLSSLAAVAPNGKSKLAAALFALFLGGLGIHKFYLGQTGWGIAYLLMCWTLIPALVGFIEGILFLVMSESDFNHKYGGA